MTPAGPQIVLIRSLDDCFFRKNPEDLDPLLANAYKLWHDSKNHRSISQRMGRHSFDDPSSPKASLFFRQEKLCGFGEDFL